MFNLNCFLTIIYHLSTRPGSTIVDLYLVYKNNATVNATDIKQSIQDRLQSIDGYNVTTINITGISLRSNI